MRPEARVLARRRLLVPLLCLLLGAALALAPAQQLPARAAAGALLVDNGPPAQRVTLVLVGDGYTAAELPRFRRQAAAVWQALTRVEPFRTYQRFFNVRRVDLVSPRSGLHRGSPLGMHFGCDGVSRMLCADSAAVKRSAGASGGPQYEIALANSAAYGGEGGDDGVATLAAGSPDAAAIVQHEMGHTVGGLGDEYDSAPADAGYPNLASADAGSLRAQQQKWWRWLGAADPTGGQVGAYRSRNGLFRPTRDSIMRTLGGSYNLPSREAIIESLYRQVGPIDSSAPAPGDVSGRPVLRVAPVPLVGSRRIAVSWQVDGHAPPAGAVLGDSLDTSRLDPASGGGQAEGQGDGQPMVVSATVRDTTPWLRDEAFRGQRMAATVSWTLRI